MKTKHLLDDLYVGLTHLANEMNDVVRHPVLGAKTDGERKMEKFCKDMIADFVRQLERSIGQFEQVRDAAKPLCDYDFGDYITPWKELRVKGEIIDGAAETADGFPFSLVSNDSCGFDYAEYINFANMIGAFQNVLKKAEVGE